MILSILSRSWCIIVYNLILLEKRKISQISENKTEDEETTEKEEKTSVPKEEQNSETNEKSVNASQNGMYFYDI